MQLENHLSFTPILISYFHFSKNGSESESGIEHKYHDPCQDWLDLINMKVTSPNYPDAYDPLEYCIWNIKAPPGHFVTLDFERIDVSNNSLGMNCPMFAKCSGFL